MNSWNTWDSYMPFLHNGIIFVCSLYSNMYFSVVHQICTYKEKAYNSHVICFKDLL